MYGYILPAYPHLTLLCHAYYRAAYCGLCRAMGRTTGQCSRLFLNYDVTFLLLLRLALGESNGAEAHVRFSKKRCLAHPLRRRPTLLCGEITEYIAAMGSVLTDCKLADDRKDERGWRHFRAELVSPLGYEARYRAAKAYPDAVSTLSENMEVFAKAENADAPSADLPADAFGQVIASILSYGLEANAARIAETLGKHLGRWLYLLDAADDYESDRTVGRFNPLYAVLAVPTLSPEHRQSLENQLLQELHACELALDLLTPTTEQAEKELFPLIRNILSLSLPQTTHTVLFEGGKPAKNAKEVRLDDDGSV